TCITTTSASCQTSLTYHVNYPGRTYDHGPDETNEVREGEGLGPDGVDDRAGRRRGRLQRDAGDVLDDDRLDGIAAVAPDPEDRQMAEQPGDVVDQDVALAADDSRPDDGRLDTRLEQRPFDPAFSPEIRQGRPLVGVDDADMDDPSYTGGPGGVEERPTGLDRSV